MKKMLYAFLLISPLLFITSCEKEEEEEEVYGCTNTDAINFNTYATLDNGTCEFQRKISFYFNQEASNLFYGNGYSYLRVYVNNVYEGLLYTNFYFNSSPTCGLNTDGILTVTLPISYEAYEAVSYKLETFDGQTAYNPNTILLYGDCKLVQLGG